MAKTAAKGTSFSIGNQAVGSLKSIGGVEVTADTIDVSTLDNSDGYKEFIGGFKDGGEVALSGFFDYSDQGQQALYDAFESGAESACVITFPASMACKWTFQGVIVSYKTNVDLGDAIGFECSVKVSGKPTLGAATVSQN